MPRGGCLVTCFIIGNAKLRFPVTLVALRDYAAGIYFSFT